MGYEKPTLKGIWKELSTRGYQDRARQRQRTSKTGWDLVFMPIGYAAIGYYAYIFFKLVLWLHMVIHPDDALSLQAFMKRPTGVMGVITALAGFLAAIPLGFMTSNFLMWLVPPARRASERAAKGVKWASFRDSQRALFLMALVLVPIALVCGAVYAAMPGH